MSNVNIKRAVENIRSGTTVYTPLIEVIVNAIQAIECTDNSDGTIKVTVKRSSQAELDSSIPAIDSFEISDNGIGFNDENRQSFDTLYSDHKLQEGGKGFGRFICLKYFENLKIESIYVDGDTFKKRTFSMGKSNDIIVNEKLSVTSAAHSGSTITLHSVKDGRFTDKKSQQLLEISLISFFRTLSPRAIPVPA